MLRRRFLARLATTSVAAAAAALPYGFSHLMTPPLEAAPRGRLRPPGALADQRAFAAACIGCGLCGEVCPVRCIRFYRRDGGRLANTPYIEPEEKACSLCEKCMPVCPTGALRVTPREDIDMGIAQIDRSACYPWVDRGICGACVSVCPLGASAIDFALWNQYRPVIHSGCVGCGQCVEVCPHPSRPIRVVARARTPAGATGS